MLDVVDGEKPVGQLEMATKVDSCCRCNGDVTRRALRRRWLADIEFREGLGRLAEQDPAGIRIFLSCIPMLLHLVVLDSQQLEAIMIIKWHAGCQIARL